MHLWKVILDAACYYRAMTFPPKLYDRVFNILFRCKNRYMIIDHDLPDLDVIWILAISLQNHLNSSVSQGYFLALFCFLCLYFVLRLFLCVCVKCISIDIWGQALNSKNQNNACFVDYLNDTCHLLKLKYSMLLACSYIVIYRKWQWGKPSYLYYTLSAFSALFYWSVMKSIYSLHSLPLEHY